MYSFIFLYIFFLKVYQFFLYFFVFAFWDGWGLGLMILFRRIYLFGDGLVGFMPLFRCIYFF